MLAVAWHQWFVRWLVYTWHTSAEGSGLAVSPVAALALAWCALRARQALQCTVRISIAPEERYRANAGADGNLAALPPSRSPVRSGGSGDGGGDEAATTHASNETWRVPSRGRGAGATERMAGAGALALAPPSEYFLQEPTATDLTGKTDHPQHGQERRIAWQGSSSP